MEAKFTPTIKDVIQYSREEALANGQDYIGTEHLLLGILHEGKNAAVGVLKALKVDVAILYDKLIKTFDPTKNVNHVGSIPLTKQAEKVLKITYLEAKIHKANSINTFILLLSILRDEDSIASQILAQFKINYEIAKAFSLTSEYKIIANFEYEEQPSVEEHLDFEESIEITNTSPLGLIFDTSEYSAKEIKDILALLSELYNSIGGDYLKIKGMSQFECLTALDLA